MLSAVTLFTRCCLLLALAAPLIAQAQTRPAGDVPATTVSPDIRNQSTIAVQSSPAEDAKISARIRDILAELEGYEGVRGSTRSGVVTLTGEVLDAAALTRLEELIGGIEGVVAIQNRVAETTDLAKRLNPALERMLERGRQTVAFLPLIGVALAVAALVIALGVLIARLRQPWDRLAPNAFIADIYRQLVLLAFIIAGVVIALDILNAAALLGTILGAAGIIGLAIGFAVRDTVENFIASIMLSIRQPFQPNDTVEIEGDQGKVIRLTSRATILLSFDGNHIRIPNATVFKSRIVNFSRNDERRFQFAITVATDSDLAAARDLIERTVTGLPFTLDQPGTAVWIDDITEGGVRLTVTGWIDQTKTSLLRARGEALRLVKLALESAGFAIPDNTYRIKWDTAPPAAPTDASPRSMAAPTPPKTPPGPVAITASDDEALEQMIAEERSDESNPDLLRRDAPTE